MQLSVDRIGSFLLSKPFSCPQHLLQILKCFPVPTIVSAIETLPERDQVLLAYRYGLVDGTIRSYEEVWGNVRDFYPEYKRAQDLPSYLFYLKDRLKQKCQQLKKEPPLKSVTFTVDMIYHILKCQYSRELLRAFGPSSLLFENQLTISYQEIGNDPKITLFKGTRLAVTIPLRVYEKLLQQVTMVRSKMADIDRDRNAIFRIQSYSTLTRVKDILFEKGENVSLETLALAMNSLSDEQRVFLCYRFGLFGYSKLPLEKLQTFFQISEYACKKNSRLALLRLKAEYMGLMRSNPIALATNDKVIAAEQELSPKPFMKRFDPFFSPNLLAESPLMKDIQNLNFNKKVG